MEILTKGSVLIALGCIVVVTGLIKAVNWVWLRPRKLEKWFRQQGLPGTSYQLLVGDLKDYSSMRARALENPMTDFSSDYYSRVEPLRHQVATKYGKTYFVWAGPTPMVNIAKPELIREALTKTHIFQKAKWNPIIDKLFPGLVSYEGEKWSRHRKIINPAFHVEKLKLMLPAFHDSCAEMISKWELKIDDVGSGELDVRPDLMKLTADVISRAAFGSSYEEGQKIFELLKEQTDLALLMIQSVYIPGFRCIPTTRNRRFKDIERRIRVSLRAVIDKRKKEIEAGEMIKPDLLGLLLDSNLKEIHNNQQSGMSLQDIIDECKLFYVAGQETTSILLVWTLILLSKHQEWQSRAREEVLQTFADNVPDFEGLSHLKTVTMILYEVLRLYPPAMQLTRSIYKDTKLGELSLPSGTIVTFPVQTVHRDQELWGDDAQEFKPDRFAEGVSKAAKETNSFFPFSSGPRICIGEKFAITEAKIAISMILQRFSFELSPSYVHAPTSVMFLQPQYGAEIILHRL